MKYFFGNVRFRISRSETLIFSDYDAVFRQKNFAQVEIGVRVMKLTKYDLEIIWRFKAEFSALEEKLTTLREAAENISPLVDGLPKAKNATSKVENLSVKILDTEEKFAETAEKLIEMQGELRKLFERELPDEIACIFISRYIVCRTWKEIAQCYRCTISWCYLEHSKGLKILEKVQDFAQAGGSQKSF